MRLTLFFRQTVVPLFLLLACPPIVFLFWYTNVHLEGSFNKLGELFLKEGFFQTIKMIWSPYFFGSLIAWKILAIFVSLSSS